MKINEANADGLKVGVIYWDRTGSSDTYFGHHIANSLSPKKFRNKTPYYADILSEDKASFHVITAEEYDRELQYAVDAGIDYFAYTWNSREKSGRKDFPQATEEQLHAQLDEEDDTRRRLHAKSPLRDRIKLCAFILCNNEYSDADIAELVDEMKQDYYQKIDGRPLLLLYNGYYPQWIERMTKAAENAGIPKPYTVFSVGGNNIEKGDFSLADAVTGYSYVYYKRSEDDTYRDFYTANIKANDNRAQMGIDIIPHFSFGWDPTPRMERPVPWYDGYAKVDYLGPADPSDITDGAKRFAARYAESEKWQRTKNILIFAWNEFEEGAWICPTYGDDGKSVDTSRVSVLSDIISYWKRTLCKNVE